MKRKLINDRTIERFKLSMTSCEMPNYIRNYCEGLDDLGWMIFHSKLIIPMEIITHEEELIYLLKWILKDDPDDFIYDIYVHDMMGAESRGYIQDDYRDMLHERYNERFEKDFAPKDYFDSRLEDNTESG